MSINAFLDTIKQVLAEKLSETQIILVMGNDSADLDSIISALLIAYLNQKKVTSNTKLYVPLVKVPSCDLALRPEVTHVFRRAGIDASKLIYIDQVNMAYWENSNNVVKPAILLVDHNRLTPPFSNFEHNCQVVSVIDHHVDEGAYLDAPLRWIEMVGSCTSQVVLLYQAEIESLLEQDKKALATLALAPILVDTIGLQWDLGKTTQKDVNAFNFLARIVFDQGAKDLANKDGLPREALVYYDTIEKVKSQVDHLCTRDLLRKDYKQWTVNGYTVGTSSMAWYLKAWVDRDGYDQVVKDAWAFTREQQLDMLLVLTSYDHSKQQQQQDGSYERELAFFVANDRLLQIKTEMENDKDVGMLSLLPTWGHDDQGGRIGFYNQKNIKLSRKQIWPRLQDILMKLD
ncbi:hypothetical protein BC941DRAFT_509005 [Chlamydoabsidia padenii]|nr:hypothetical protein BC941DRAFT_509005 [Chlamydoabsidia padenii]